ncbi:MAG: hypothetical protein AB8H03_04650 [Saprospiraceae bacterium]
MPVTKKFDGRRYFEDFEEIDEHSPFFYPEMIIEKEVDSEEDAQPIITFWQKFIAYFKLKFPKM